MSGNLLCIQIPQPHDHQRAVSEDAPRCLVLLQRVPRKRVHKAGLAAARVTLDEEKLFPFIRHKVRDSPPEVFTALPFRGVILRNKQVAEADGGILMQKQLFVILLGVFFIGGVRTFGCKEPVDILPEISADGLPRHSQLLKLTLRFPTTL
ncbi:MAG: hypothetical protein ACSW8F_01485 [bacterium]